MDHFIDSFHPFPHLPLPHFLVPAAVLHLLTAIGYHHRVGRHHQDGGGGGLRRWCWYAVNWREKIELRPAKHSVLVPTLYIVRSWGSNKRLLQFVALCWVNYDFKKASEDGGGFSSQLLSGSHLRPILFSKPSLLIGLSDIWLCRENKYKQFHSEEILHYKYLPIPKIRKMFCLRIFSISHYFRYRYSAYWNFGRKSLVFTVNHESTIWEINCWGGTGFER